jgi:pentafunctional AROM polypeptide
MLTLSLSFTDKPLVTPLIELVREANEAFEATSMTRDQHNLRQGTLWTGITGVTIVLEQGCHQFRKWTGTEVPRGYVEGKAWEQYLKK